MDECLLGALASSKGTHDKRTRNRTGYDPTPYIIIKEIRKFLWVGWTIFKEGPYSLSLQNIPPLSGYTFSLFSLGLANFLLSKTKELFQDNKPEDLILIK